ncbi:hypothetical protein N1851_031566 [Merluccius polli]|uniref:Uncharacterized protein n=1 Tax=Merluccius polli TaxID=89951 RepID=A0AA47M3V5_MERPO|nr:hypothetical protein N1851_031566 [Merluccius polli]
MELTQRRCILCQGSDETAVTGPLSTKDSVTAHQNCLYPVPPDQQRAGKGDHSERRAAVLASRHMTSRRGGGVSASASSAQARWRVSRGRMLSRVQVNSEQVGLERKDAKQGPSEL